MTKKLRIQLAFLTVSTFVVGVAFGFYLASVYVGVRVAELVK